MFSSFIIELVKFLVVFIEYNSNIPELKLIELISLKNY